MMSNEGMLSEFEEKVVIVTGAASGIGRAVAIEFAREGAVLVLVDVLEKELAEVERIIKKMGKRVLPLRKDVSDYDQVLDVVKRTVEKFGDIDVLVNSAGIAGPNGPLVNLTEEDWDRILMINLKSVFLFCKSVLPVMIKNKKGKIVNIASIAGKEGNENQSAYSASKAGVISLSRALAKELAVYGIRVNSVAPALIRTSMASSIPEEFADTLLRKIPMGRMGEPEEVANLIVFLSSDKSSFITGQCFNVTGGRGDY
jgi:NAD(P)-dependent dehydrogenase (short-subunit alcohol dehydrogenase family)